MEKQSDLIKAVIREKDKLNESKSEIEERLAQLHALVALSELEARTKDKK